jgi:hypothetical protein
MRVAVCLSGEIRGNPEHWQSVYEKIIKPNNADVFMHHIYYGDDVMNELSYFQRLVMQEYHKNKGLSAYPPSDIFRIFGPKLIEFERKKMYPIEHFDAIKDKINHYNSLPQSMVHDRRYWTDECTQMMYHGVMSQIESRKRVMMLKTQYEKEHGFEYDAVILTRIDVDLSEPLLLTSPPSCLYAHFHSPDLIYEILTYGSSSAMNVFETYFDNLPRLFKEHCNSDHHINQSEYLHLKYFQEMGLRIEKPPFKEFFNQNTTNGFRRFTH